LIAEAVAQSAEHGRKDELHDGVESNHYTDVRRDTLGVRNLLKKPRKNRENKADAYGVEHDCREDNEKGSVHRRFWARAIPPARTSENIEETVITRRR
jgi:hypothetical protein